LAEEFAHKQGATLAPSATELECGWYFAWDDDIIGSHGLAVSKETGRIFEFGSAFGVERDLRLYDRGMDAERHDVVVLSVANLNETVAVLQRLRPYVIELSYEAGTVWRIPRELTEDEIRDRVGQLPAIFPEVALYFNFEAVEEARSSGCCAIELFPRSP
jgi:hypothetical protein